MDFKEDSLLVGNSGNLNSYFWSFSLWLNSGFLTKFSGVTAFTRASTVALNASLSSVKRATFLRYFSLFFSLLMWRFHQFPLTLSVSTVQRQNEFCTYLLIWFHFRLYMARVRESMMLKQQFEYHFLLGNLALIESSRSCSSRYFFHLRLLQIIFWLKKPRFLLWVLEFSSLNKIKSDAVKI